MPPRARPRAAPRSGRSLLGRVVDALTLRTYRESQRARDDAMKAADRAKDVAKKAKNAERNAAKRAKEAKRVAENAVKNAKDADDAHQKQVKELMKRMGPVATPRV